MCHGNVGLAVVPWAMVDGISLEVVGKLLAVCERPRKAGERPLKACELQDRVYEQQQPACDKFQVVDGRSKEVDASQQDSF